MRMLVATIGFASCIVLSSCANKSKIKYHDELGYNYYGKPIIFRALGE